MRLALLFVALLGAAAAAAPVAEEREEAVDEEQYLRHLDNVDEPLTDEEEAMLEALSRPDDEEEEEQAENGEVELEMEPASEEQQAPAVAEPAKDDAAAKMANTAARGQAEYEAFYDPVFSASAQRPNKPTVEVKRARTLHFDDESGWQLGKGNVIFVGIVGVCAVVALAGTAIAGVAYYKLNKQTARAADAGADASLYGISGPAKERRAVQGQVRARGDQKNAYSAQLHHYQQTKSEILRMEQASAAARGEQAESEESEQEGDEPDYSVYECPGLAPTGDIEVANPMFDQQANEKK